MSLVKRDDYALINDHHYMDRLERTAGMLARSSMCPETWRVKPGEPQEVVERKVADLQIIGMALAELDMRLTVNTLPECYVVHGRPGFMAQLQAALAARAGVKVVPLNEQSTAEVGKCKILGKDGEWHVVSVTIDEATKAGWVAKNQNYKSQPKNMLMARALTRAIGGHYPEVKFGMPAAFVDEGEGIPLDAVAQPELQPDMVPAAIAKTKLVQTFMESFENERAVEMASELWKLHGYGRDPITRDQLEEILTEAAPVMVKDDVIDVEVVDEQTGEIIEGGEPFVD